MQGGGIDVAGGDGNLAVPQLGIGQLLVAKAFLCGILCPGTQTRQCTQGQHSGAGSGKQSFESIHLLLLLRCVRRFLFLGGIRCGFRGIVLFVAPQPDRQDHSPCQ